MSLCAQWEGTSTLQLVRSVQVIARAMKLWQEEGKKAFVARRTTFTSGDFFKPGGLTSLCNLNPAARNINMH
jgi:hypothetical protein